MAEIEYTPNLNLAKQPTGAREWGTVLNENFDKIDAKAGVLQGSYNVGDIFYSMRTEKEFNGAAVCDGTIYNISDFSGASTIGELLTAGKLPYVSMSEYDTTLTANGRVRCFGWDGGETFRVPTLNDVFIQAGDSVRYCAFVQLASKVRDVSLQDYTSQLQETSDALNADIRLIGAETKNFIDESVKEAEIVFENLKEELLAYGTTTITYWE